MLLAPVGPFPASSDYRPRHRPTYYADMRLLVLGGTAFVGRDIVDVGISRGHQITLFNRGRTGRDLFPDLALCMGDRDTGDYTTLLGRSWDAAIDVTGYVPRHVEQAGRALEGSVGRYLFVSTGSVYDLTKIDTVTTETSPRLCPERGTEEITDLTYGRLKVSCEDDVEARFGHRSTIVRPGVVAGPHDPTDRFTYWVRRAARGGRVALAGRVDQPVQVINVHDLSRFVLTLAEQDTPGAYNAVGPAAPLTLSELIYKCAQAAGSTVVLQPIDPASVQPALPLVLTDPRRDPMYRRSLARALGAGLTSTPIELTAAEVLSWTEAAVSRGLPWASRPNARCSCSTPQL
jgi:2'-hydroxyisoflavone reductase